MDVAQARDYLDTLTSQPAMKVCREHGETLEEVVMLLDDVDSLMKHLDLMPDFEPEDRSDREWVERLKQLRDNLKSYGDAQFLENVLKKLV
jgi:hypothetical protein